ncbi:hydro-lyase, Fe-S type, tartrate/fumarate subfamily, beta subunit [Methanolacinia petrolearia DSM 11571]|uniref:Hydro-lyase, Fe-S type, tartrate/fumarate subfamily, beta subunit n=1 Tax=Methanolacinia petrolearia (strain DSM 11571 / OCM 486 / SEBR 4847) TaxID=679926 RepID=E1RKT4_METP4|nr:FumA C-terminus/TtdB family hydratase beta subunit [Methanolacinia petrolearia]ADN37023.1 hydro-lyase, Fe-S type, tartrate/fumarate subfamily, beta subunit [Methanolacinia petrolearia DSM 11571]
MNPGAIQLKTPLGEEVLDLRAGDRVELSGTIYTARDEAHLRMKEAGIPFDPEGAVIFHCGPVVAGGRIIAAGPTTSARMNPLCEFLLDAGVSAFIGKGGMSDEVSSLMKGRAVYLAYTGGCAALAASKMKLKGVYYEDLGMAEAIWEIEVDRLPLTVAMDAHGGNLYSGVIAGAKKAFGSGFPTD